MDDLKELKIVQEIIKAVLKGSLSKKKKKESILWNNWFFSVCENIFVAVSVISTFNFAALNFN